ETLTVGQRLCAVTRGELPVVGTDSQPLQLRQQSRERASDQGVGIMAAGATRRKTLTASIPCFVGAIRFSQIGLRCALKIVGVDAPWMDAAVQLARDRLPQLHPRTRLGSVAVGRD